MNSQVIIFAVLILGVSQAEVFNRPCRTLDQYGGVKLGFIPGEYLKLWYEIERYEQPFQRGTDCVTANYTLNTDGSIRVDNRAKNLNTGERLGDIGRAVLSFPNQSPLPAML